MDTKKETPYYFEPKKVGEDLSEVALELLNVENYQVESRWFHSQFETDLFIWSDQKGVIIKQQLSFYGQVVEWNAFEGTRTGVILEDEVGASGIKPSEVVQFDASASDTTINMAIEIISNITKIKEPLKDKIITNFKHKKPHHINIVKETKGAFAKLRTLFKK